MKDFIYQVPTKFIKENGAERKIGNELTAEGVKNILLVSSGDSFETPLMKEIEEILRNSNIIYTRLQGVQPNPHLTLVREGVQLCKREKIGFILAVGGGSVIDTAKAIAAGACYEDDVWDFFERKSLIECALPIGVVLTYPATGSESSNVAVINNTEVQKKLLISSSWIIPRYAFLNPVLTYTLPARMTARGITDIFSHICERYFCEEETVGVVDRMAEATLKTLVEIGERCLREPEDYELRSEIMWIGSIAQNNFLGLGRTQDWCVHALGNELSALFNCIHGDTLSVMMGSWMRYVYRSDIPRFARYARCVFGVDNTLTPVQQAEAGIERTERFFEALHMPLKVKEIVNHSEENDIRRLARQIPLQADGTTGAVRKLNRSDLEEIYRMAWQ